MRLIDADALKEYFFRPYSNEEVYSNIDIEEIIDAQPTVEQIRWIPCSERLPAIGKPVLISALMPLCTMVYIGYLSDDVWFCDRLFFRSDEVVAWMPLSDAYEE